MNEFLRKLDELEAQLKKEEVNGQQASRVVSKDCRISDRSSNGGSDIKNQHFTDSDNGSRSSNVLRRRISSEELNNVQGKERKVMITIEDAIKDLEAVEMSAVTDGIKIVRALKVVVKFLSTMRSNQLLTDEAKVAIQKAKVERQAKPVTKA